MPPKIQIKRTKTNLYPEKFTKEKHLTIDIKRKNKPDITIHRGVGKNKVTGEKSVTRMTTKIDRNKVDGKTPKMAQNMVVNRKDASGNKTKIYKTGGGQFKGGIYYKGSDKASYQEAKKTNRDAVRNENTVKRVKEGPVRRIDSVATKRGIKNATKMNEARDAYMNNPGKYDAAKVSKAMDTGRGRKVERVMRRESKRGTSSF
jgi:hypothetical protein